MFAFIIGALFGAFVGSFLNVCVHRLPRNESVVTPRSRCYACGTQVAAWDNIPVLSWLILRGRCRWCGSPFSIRYMLGEITVGLLSGAVCWYALWQMPGQWASDGSVFWLYLFQPAGALWWHDVIAGAAGICLLTYLYWLWTCSLIDLQHTIIPDELTKPMQLLAPLLVCLVPTPMALGGWSPAEWYLRRGLDDTWSAAPWAGFGTVALIAAIAVAVLLLSLPLARWVYGRHAAAGMQWSDDDHRGFRVGVLWFTFATICHVAVLAGVVLWVSMGASRIEELRRLWLAAHLSQAILGSLAGWMLLYVLGLGATVAFGRNALGFGDVKFLAPLGALLGPFGIIYAFFAAAICGALVGLPKHLLKRGREIPFGPQLALGVVVVFLWGPRIHAWVMGGMRFGG